MSKLTVPEGGTPAALYTPEEFAEAAEILAAGTGPIAIDTERAANDRYDDRAFLLQIRRKDTPIFLIAPEGHRNETTEIFAPVLNGEKWIIHSAINDLPCLAWLGLYPGSLFDTELAARMAGYEHSGLSAMMDQLLDLQIEKKYSRVNWSAYPLPKAWLAYAALDVDRLIDLAELLEDELREYDYLDWAEQEFAHIVEQFSGDCAPPQDGWRHLPKVGALKKPVQLAAAKALWTDRDNTARERDVSPYSLLPNKALVDAARTLPTTVREVYRLEGFTRRHSRYVKRVLAMVRSAQSSAPSTWPQPTAERTAAPNKRMWKKHFPVSWDRYQSVREEIDFMAQDFVMRPDIIIEPRVLEATCWALSNTLASRNSSEAVSPEIRKLLPLVDPIASSVRNEEDIFATLRTAGARQWQAEQVAPVIADIFLGDIPEGAI